MTLELPAELTEGRSLAEHAFGEQLRDALEDSRVAVALMDTELRYVWAVNLRDSSGQRALAGQTDEELYGLASQGLTRLKRRALASGKEERGELRLTADGSERYYELTVSPRRDSDSAVGGLLCVMIEITARRRAEDTLARLNADLEARIAERTTVLAYTVERLEREVAERRRAEDRLAALNTDLQHSRDLLRTAFDGIEDGLMLLDRSGMILAANQRFAALGGAASSDLVGRHWWGYFAQADAAFPRCMIQASLSDGQARLERARFPIDGQLHILDVHTLPLEKEGHYLDQLVVHMRDVTEQVRLEAQMIESERFTANQHLAAAVAHEVNTPLQAIESCLHLAGKLPDADQRGRYLRLAREEIQRIGHILRQLLDLYRPSQGSAAPLMLNDLVERALLLVGTSLTRQRVSVECDLADDLPTLFGRADELTQVLLNLIFNAMQAMPRGGKLTLRTRCEQSEGGPPLLSLAVADSGPGIEAEVMARMFEPFFTTRPDGNGLGLAISQRLVAAHGGTITVTSAPGAGATFHVSLPLERGASAPAEPGL